MNDSFKLNKVNNLLTIVSRKSIKLSKETVEIKRNVGGLRQVKTTKNIIIATIVAMFVFIVTDTAKSSTGTVLLFGNVAQNVDLQIDHTEANFPLDIEGGETATEIATVTEFYNVAGGYDIDVTSANGGLANGSDVLDYEIDYDGNTANASTTTGTLEIVSAATSPTLSTGNAVSLAVTFAAHTTAVAGTYLDELTLTIRAP